MHINSYLFTTALTITLLFGQVNAISLDQPLDYIAPLTLDNRDLANGGRAFRGGFENGYWQGDLFSYEVAKDGSVTNPPVWSAADQFSLAEANNPNYWTKRKIVFGATAGGRSFKWDNLTQAQQTMLTRPVVQFIRGYRAGESKPLRQRKNLLGAIIHSNPVYVGAPNADIDTSGYKAFVTANAQRTPLVYVGANDGMLHGFNAATGVEEWAYIPSMLMASLPRLADNPYTPTYYVDGGLKVQDVQFSNSRWHTLLAGSLGAGGKGLFAVNITRPNGQRVLWELHGGSDSDMGYIFGAGSIVKLNDNNWYVANGNGFNSGSGNAVLYLIDVETGAISKKIGVGNRAAGLSAPTFIDVDGDNKVDIAYAGDLRGDMWRFDLRNVKKITVDKIYDGNPAQPISTAPDIAKHPLGGYWVLFGTGHSYNGIDNTAAQAIYGIHDNGGAPVRPINLLKRTLSQNINYTSGNVKETVRIFTNARTKISHQQGWQINLPIGEKLLTPLQLRDGRLRATITKVNTDPRLNENWLLEATYDEGGSDPKGFFDLNNNGQINLQDRVLGNKDKDKADLEDIPVAWKRNNGLLSQTTIARIAKDVDALFFNSLPTAEAPPTPPTPPTPPRGCVGNCDGGLEGGHIDVDTDLTLGDKTDVHVHEYDDKTGLTYVDYFNIKQGLDNVDTSESFIILIANADLSPGAEMIVGKDNQGKDISYNVAEYQQKIHQALAKWNGNGDLKDPDSGRSLIHSANSLKKNGGTLRIQFDSRAIAHGGIIPSNTGCIRGNDIYNDRWRNGALTMHLVKRQHFNNASNALAKVKVQKPDDLVKGLYINGKSVNLSNAGGLLANNSGGFLYENTIFWHYEGGACYGEEGYEEDVRNARFRLLLIQNGVDPDIAEKAKISDDCDLGQKNEKDKQKKDKNKKKDKDKKDNNSPVLDRETCEAILEQLENNYFSGGSKGDDGTNGGGDNNGGENPGSDFNSDGDGVNSKVENPIETNNSNLQSGRASWTDMLPN